MNENEKLCIITIYDSPIDFPNKIVSREFYVSRGKKIECSDKTKFFSSILDAKKFYTAKGLHFLNRDASDNKSIVGTFI